MHSKLVLVLIALAAVLATVATVCVVKADLPAGETAGKISLAWFSPLTALAVFSSRRRRHRAIGRF